MLHALWARSTKTKSGTRAFSGGAKIAFPGLAGREIQERNQWEASLRMSETVMGVADNPMRLRMEEAARLIGLNYIANIVSDYPGTDL